MEKNFNNIIYTLFLSSVQIKRFHHFRLFLFLCKTFHLGECHIISGLFRAGEANTLC